MPEVTYRYEKIQADDPHADEIRMVTPDALLELCPWLAPFARSIRAGLFETTISFDLTAIIVKVM